MNDPLFYVIDPRNRPLWLPSLILLQIGAQRGDKLSGEQYMRKEVQAFIEANRSKRKTKP